MQVSFIKYCLLVSFTVFSLESMDKALLQEVTYTHYTSSYPHKEQLSKTDWQFKLDELFLKNDNDTKRIIAEHNQKPIASIVFFSDSFGDKVVGHISYLEVMMNYRNQKIGSYLLALATCELIATDHCSWVTLNSLKDSRQFYKRNNFEQVGGFSSFLLRAKSAQEVKSAMGIESLPILIMHHS